MRHRPPRTTKVKPNEWRASMIEDALRSSHPSGQYAFVAQVPNGTSYNKSRTADAMVMGCWASVGIALTGYEIKVTRSDWLKEIQDVRKAEAFTKHCHYWWVIAPEGIVKLEEMPVHWGLKECTLRNDGTISIRVKKAATHNPTAALDYDFFAAILRQAISFKPDDSAIKERIQNAVEQTQMKERARHAQAILAKPDDATNPATYRLSQLEKDVAGFEKASGVKFSGYNIGEKIGEALKLWMEFGHPSEPIQDIENTIHWIRKRLKRVKAIMGVTTEKEEE